MLSMPTNFTLLIFPYECNNCRYRLLRHHFLVNTIESLSVRALAQRACKHSTGTSEATETGGDFLISCELENLSQVWWELLMRNRQRLAQISIRRSGLICVCVNILFHRFPVSYVILVYDYLYEYYSTHFAVRSLIIICARINKLLHNFL